MTPNLAPDEPNSTSYEELLYSIFEFHSLRVRHSEGALSFAGTRALRTLEVELGLRNGVEHGPDLRVPISRQVLVLLPDAEPVTTRLVDLGATGAEVVSGAWAKAGALWLLCGVRDGWIVFFATVAWLRGPRTGLEFAGPPEVLPSIR